MLTLLIVYSNGCYECGGGQQILGIFDLEHKALAEDVAAVGMYNHMAWVEEVELNEPWTWYSSPARVARRQP